jgi:hypothetical protein
LVILSLLASACATKTPARVTETISSVPATPTALPPTPSLPAISTPTGTLISTETSLPAATRELVQPYRAFDGWQVYTSPDGSFAFSYPPQAKIDLTGMNTFPSEEQPEGVSTDEYFAQLAEMYPEAACISVQVGLGFVTFQTPSGMKYANPCGVSGIGAVEIEHKTEAIQVGGESLEADKSEIYGYGGSGQEKTQLDEYYSLNYPQGNVITFGSLCIDQGKPYQDYLADKPTLLKILSSYSQDPRPVKFPETDQPVLTIYDDEPVTGPTYNPAPDSFAVMANSFRTAGDYWLLDSAGEQQRLVHLSTGITAKINYDIAGVIDLDRKVVKANDLEVRGSTIWVLDTGSQPARVLKLSLKTPMNGEATESFELPAGLRLEDGLTGLSQSQGGQLLVELNGGAVLYRLFNEAGAVEPKKLEGATFRGTLYRVELAPLSKRGVVSAGDTKVEIAVERPISLLRVLGAAPDGSFLVAVDQVDEGSRDIFRQVRRYSAAGEWLGTAFPQISEIQADHDLIANWYGTVFQLVSNPDYSVQVVRLGFRTGQAAQIEPGPTRHAESTETPLLSCPPGEGDDYIKTILALADEHIQDIYQAEKLEELTDAGEIAGFREKAVQRLAALQELQPPACLQEVHARMTKSFELMIAAWDQITARDYAQAKQTLLDSFDPIAEVIALIAMMNWEK